MATPFQNSFAEGHYLALSHYGDMTSSTSKYFPVVASRKSPKTLGALRVEYSARTSTLHTQHTEQIHLKLNVKPGHYCSVSW